MTRETTLECRWEYGRTVNFAMQQNHVPVVRRLWLHNGGDADLEDVTVSIASEPAFAAPWSKTLDVVPAGATVDVGVVDLRLSPTVLAELTERVAGSLDITVTRPVSSAGDADPQAERETLFAASAPIDALAFDEWSGLAALPEMIAAFVAPNHPEIARIVRSAADILAMWDGRASFNAYQSKDQNQVRRQVAAIYAALQNEQVTYAVAPASFEPIGQRVRLPDALFGRKMGNCLDMTVAFAACLEAVGLHPLIVFTKGHAFVGAWLVEETFAECVQDDLSLLTKRLAPGIHEVCLVESTAATARGGDSVSFEDASRAAERHLADPESFFAFVDVKRTRASSIRPLPLRVPTPNGWEIRSDDGGSAGAAASAAALRGAVPEALEVLDRPEEVSALPMTKQREWERRLLDLSLRNTLLNFRATRSSIPVMSTQLGDLEDALAGNDEFQLLPMPGDWSDTPRDAELYRRIASDHPVAALIKQEFLLKRLRADLTERELNDRVVHLYRQSRAAMEENGANTLYLALGLLQWYETEASRKPRYAPLVLLPVELVRKTSRSGIVLRARDEEPQFNITLLEMLRQDFGIAIGGFETLPKDDNGVDLKRIFATVRQAVMSLPRWDVMEAAYVGLFSFSQFVMWNDIHSRAEQLAGNKVVASLMAGSMTWTQPDAFPEASTLDETFHPKELLVPISADSSQLAAIAAAGAGNSFVLHGPPGTGKSQTITNLIANALANGKTVLFVAEKMAALTVVQRRLAAIGLDPFSLELHSNKSKKKAVLEQLRLALEAGGARSAEAWAKQADRLAEARRALNGYVEALHRKRPFGLSLYDALARYESVRAAPDVVAFAPEDVAGLADDERMRREDAAKELRAAAEGCGHPHRHPWREATCAEYTPTLRSSIASTIAELERQLAACSSSLEELRGVLPIAFGDERASELDALAKLCEWLLSAPGPRVDALLREERIDDAAAKLKTVAGHGAAKDALREELAAWFSPAALTFDAAGALAAWRQANLQWLLPRWLGQRRILGMLRSMAAPGRRLEKAAVEERLADIVRYQEEQRAVQAASSFAAPIVGEAAWAGGEADWRRLERLAAWAEQAPKLTASVAADREAQRKLLSAVAERFESGSEAFLERYGPSLRGYAEARRRMEETERELATKLGIDDAAWQGETESWFETLRERLGRWQSNLDGLRDWCAWRRLREKALSVGLAPLVDAYESGRVTNDEAVPAFERGLYRAWAEAIVTSEEALRTFSSRLFEETIAAFRETTGRYEELTRQEIVARLSAKVPNAGGQAAVQSSELGILERAIRSGGRGVSIRRLFEQIPNVLRRLCPCMLMSPISVAQYVDPSLPPFDIVVFDEASQMPTSEAVGAMARGRDVIVVGDPKQLPPTSFFSSGPSADGDDDGSVLKEDMESVLDDCLALRMPQGHLLWHYRSRHESLIAFSNMQYYENKLFTFPSPNERVSSVRWIPVDGVYDRGRTKQNRAEAEAVVAEVLRRLKDPESSSRSIGVVTFSSVQQSLIEDLLDEAFRANPDAESAAMEAAEPIFVKNLENVQGDERDVILFSIGYGPDANGKVTLNFGPLNRDGGWRRLNVAVSRARHEMLVFSTLRPDQLDVSRTAATGVAGLKAFLEYAAHGRQALALRTEAAAMSKSHGVEKYIAEALRSRGYDVEERVGCSGYRIDAAVVHPERPGSFALGIVCDGATYRTAATARDRDLLRMDVLTQLGWKLHHVWSLEWWENPERELERIVAAIEGALEAPAAPPTAPEPASIPVPPAQAEAPLGAPSAKAEAAAPPTEATPSPNAEYAPCALESVSLPTEEFYSPSRDRLIQDQLRQVVDAEGPICRALLNKRVLQAWGIARAGARIDRRIDELLAGLRFVRTERNGTAYYWPAGADPSTYDTYRPSSQEANRRSADELPPEETAAAMKALLAAHISLQRDDLLRETARAFGYQRSGAALDKAMQAGLELALERGFASIDDQDRVIGGA
ncbi:DUF3320 domain-containing protein [Paenibacillus antri]|uniref:DUF3320 domain-containing protein n=1 Tax=Paenibacillus antri TaxID=2582848 RepID=UPI001305370E|nr:DUF3320 domain-containing protein [Paenibacillus antri]